jgi:Uma2 family endonuclease
MNVEQTVLAEPPITASPGLITVEEWGAMEMPPYYELVNGTLQETPEVAFWQDILLVKLSMFLAAHVEQYGLGYVAGPNSRLRISALRGRMPDLFLIRPDQVPLAGRNVFRGVPPFAVEAVSPTTEHIDRTEKRDEYAQLGIGQYWIVDFPNRAIEIYKLRELPDGGRSYELTETVTGEGVFRPSLFPGLEIPLARVWPTAFENRSDD